MRARREESREAVLGVIVRAASGLTSGSERDRDRRSAGDGVLWASERGGVKVDAVMKQNRRSMPV